MEDSSTQLDDISLMVCADEPVQGESHENEEDSDVEVLEPVIFTRKEQEDSEGDSAVESEEEDVVQGSKKRKRTNRTKLPLPPEFKPLSILHHRSFVALPETLLAGSANPLAIFRLFFSDSILTTIVTNTNLYAKEKEAGMSGREWLNVEREELLIWIAITIYSGIYKAGLDFCWNTNKQEPVNDIAQYMTRIRYEQIKRYLHVSPPSTEINMYYDKLEPLLSHVRDTSKKLYGPSSNVSVDEMIIRFSGRSAHSVRMKNKPTPEGFKIISLCDAGYTYTFLPTSRIVPAQAPSIDGLSRTSCMVAHLAKQLPYTWQSFTIYMDNYFTNIRLFQYLRDIGIGACGTARNQSGFPKELNIDKSAKLDWDTRSGVIIGGVMAVFWQDNGPIKMLTTVHEMIGDEWEVVRERRRPRETSTNAVKVRAVFGQSARKEMKILKVVDDYNFHMGGVDIADQLRSYYNTQQPTRRNWMPLFFWLLDTSIVNSYILCRKIGYTESHKTFRKDLTWEIIKSVRNSNRRPQRINTNPLTQRRPRTTKGCELTPLRLAEKKHIAEWRIQRASCAWCSWRAVNGLFPKNQTLQIQSQLWCVDCNVPLCANKQRSCFKDYHTNNNPME